MCFFFLLENMQPTPVETDVLISNLRLKNAYKAKYFNDYLFFSLKNNIRKNSS